LTTIEVDLDARAFFARSVAEGWGDGLPCVPPTPDLVAEYLACTSRASGDVVGYVPPSKAACTVELIAVNAAMAGAPPESMPLLIASIEAMLTRDFHVQGLNATTAPVVPAMIVNGPIRNQLAIPYERGCFGGAGGNGASIGRATRLIMRNVAGQEVGKTSESVFGQPARVVGTVVGEWEEESPWAPLAERRGVAGDAVTVFGSMGTANICDTVAQKATALLEVIGKSIAYLGCNAFLAATSHFPGEVVVAINPVWAREVLAKQLPSIEDVAQVLWQYASVPIEWFPEDYRGRIEDLGRVKDGQVALVKKPDDLILFVCGGRGSLHATMMHGFGQSYAATQPITK
jgi:hypothetical protein